MQKSTPTTTKKNNINRGSWVIPIIAGVLVALIIRYFFVNLVRVDGGSMTPNLENNQLVFSWRNKEVKRGSIIVFNAKEEDSSISKSSPSTYVKRVIGLPGDTVEYRNGNLYVNKTEVNQQWISKKEQLATSMGMNQDVGWSLNSLSLSLNWPDKERYTEKVPKNSYFVLGDNRSVSKDSRQFGFIDRKNVKGVANLPFWASDKKNKQNVNDAWKNFFVVEDEKKSSKSSSSSSKEEPEIVPEETGEEIVE